LQDGQKQKADSKEEEIEIEALNRQIKEASEKIKDSKRLKEEVENTTRELAKLKKDE
jgi:hypothetical protein